jgi:chitinase
LRTPRSRLPLALAALLAGSGVGPARAASPSPYVVIAYVFPRTGVVDPATIAVEKLTHINFAFANVVDGRVVEGSTHDADELRALTGLRRRRPDLKVLASVGGWTWSGAFSDAVLTPEARARFVGSAVEFLRRHDLDGIDIDWEYPGLPGNDNVHRPEDTRNFTAVMAELRSALDGEGAARGRHYLLTFAAAANPEYLEHVEIGKVQESVDFVNLMTYDFREGSDALAGHHANLYLNPSDDKRLSTDRAVRSFLLAGTPPGKLVVGVPFYGRGWAQVRAEAHGLYQPGRPLSGLDLHYGALVGLIGHAGWARFWDDRAQAPFLWNADKREFVSYDDPESLRVKCRYVRSHGLAGMMFWEYYADSTGTLLDTLAKELGVDRRK